MQILSQNSAFNHSSALYPLKEEAEVLKSSPSDRDAMTFPENRPVLCLPKSIIFMNPSIKFQSKGWQMELSINYDEAELRKATMVYIQEVHRCC